MKKNESFLADSPEGRLKLLRDVTFSYQEVPDGKQRAGKLIDILSEAVYAYVKRNGSIRKQSPLSGAHN